VTVLLQSTASKSVANGSVQLLSVTATATEDGMRCNTAVVGRPARHAALREGRASAVETSTWTNVFGVERLLRVGELVRMMSGRTGEINVAMAVVAGLVRRRGVADLREDR
jgi:hypothetical protein